MSIDIGVFGIRDVPSTYSGYETFLTQLLPELVRRGHRVTTYVRAERDDDASFQGVRRVPTRSVSSKQLDTLTHSWTAGWSATRARHDVVLVCNVANALALLAYRPFGLRTVLNVDGQEWMRGKWGRFGRAYFRGSAHLARFSARALVNDCVAMADVYRDEFHADSVVIPYCSPFVDRDDVAIRAALQPLGVEPGQFVVTGGRLVPENNIERIAAAYAAGDQPYPLLVVGEANYDSPVTRELRRLATADDRIRPIGHVAERATFGALLGGARLYLHGHSVGGINPSMVEALSIGANIAALDTPFNREAMGDAGLTFRLDTDFHEVVRDALDGDHIEVRRTRAIERARSLYSLDAIADAYEQLLVDAADARAPSFESMWTRVERERRQASPST